MPSVTASEAGKAQPENRIPKRVFELWATDTRSVSELGINLLKQGIIEGENPVCDSEIAAYGSCS